MSAGRFAIQSYILLNNQKLRPSSYSISLYFVPEWFRKARQGTLDSASDSSHQMSWMKH